ncbi:Nuclear transcription factor Y subunit A [Parasponia andersonii]|uniref:Nuclear transcription factor Y subunit n=1 Tax=Parasponia andersonii TaxID=3476 RepID=A0A2P5CDJ8_PARAD|nr:Nuclear transcription factor Y subunit A [Parasponia andersonii]
MRSKSQNKDRLGLDSHSISPTNVYSEPWWRNVGYNPGSLPMTGGNASNSSSLEFPNGGSESNEDQSLSNDGPNEEDDDGTKDSHVSASPQSGNRGQEHQIMQHVSSTVPAVRDECLTHHPQLELVGHSIQACASNPYQDPYYGGMMAAYGHQPMGYPPFYGMPQARMPLPLEMAQEPVYVNAKQYQGILRRRRARAKAEAEKRLIKNRKPYLHESRHQHAMRRARGTGGRFAKKTDADTSNCTEKERGSGSGQAHSSLSACSSGSEPLASDSNETWNSPNSQQEAYTALNYINGNGCYQNHGGMQDANYQLCPSERAEEGDCSGQQRGSLSTNRASQRRLAIQ